MARNRKEKWRLRRQESALIDLEQQILEAAGGGDSAEATEALTSLPVVKLAVIAAAAEAIDILLTDDEIPCDEADKRGLFSYELEHEDEFMPTLGLGRSV